MKKKIIKAVPAAEAAKVELKFEAPKERITYEEERRQYEAMAPGDKLFYVPDELPISPKTKVRFTPEQYVSRLEKSLQKLNIRAEEQPTAQLSSDPKIYKIHKPATWEPAVVETAEEDEDDAIPDTNENTA
jgi:hypothetical protein